MSKAIREVPLETIWHIRQEVMYPQMSVEEMQLPDDATGTHLGLFDEGQLISVISLFIQNDALQFRKFATLERFQRKGYGRMLLRAVFDRAKKEGIRTVWCNARTTAVDLYRQFGMEPFGDTWEQHGHQFVKMQVQL